MMRRTLLVLLAAGLAVGLAGCGERSQVVVYKQGTYQGKRDMAPYDGAPWNGNAPSGATRSRTRAQAQNEYKRIGELRETTCAADLIARGRGLCSQSRWLGCGLPPRSRRPSIRKEADLAKRAAGTADRPAAQQPAGLVRSPLGDATVHHASPAARPTS